MKRRGWIASFLLFLTVAVLGAGLAAWKRASIAEGEALAASQPEPMEAVSAAPAREHRQQRTTTAIGTVVALRSITLRNELAGTVRESLLVPGQVVETGTVLVALDVSVEEAELRAAEAQAALADAVLGRMERASQNHGASAMDVDKARAERDVARAQIERTKAVIARKTLRAPFRARVGMADVHVGQYLNEGTLLTTLQGVDESVHVDFTVPQAVAARLGEGDRVEVLLDARSPAIEATIAAVDARVDPATRSGTVRARVDGAAAVPPPGASVRVRVPLEEPRTVVAVPASALRKGPEGDHVFVIQDDPDGKARAHARKVESGAVFGDEVAILSGLAAGETVASSGSFKLREGVLVAVVPDGPPAEAPAEAPAAVPQEPR